MRIIVGVDGSPGSARAVEWCAAYAPKLQAEVVAVHSLDSRVHSANAFDLVPITAPIVPELSESERERIHDVIERVWCAPLIEAGVPLRVDIAEGSAAAALEIAAEEEAADLVVVGARGGGGFAELLLGGTSHHLSHHLDCALVIVPIERATT